MPPVRFETTISVGERPQIYALDRAATGTGSILFYIAETVGLCAASLRKRVFSFPVFWDVNP